MEGRPILDQGMGYVHVIATLWPNRHAVADAGNGRVLINDVRPERSVAR
jgi:hypothetical protein